ncbi:Zinc finger protein plag1 [Entophlyctis sp. JEL0112]|nr:Zinc finger protein plag1 [Entophlyctis sp. JEL0112]
MFPASIESQSPPVFTPQSSIDSALAFSDQQHAALTHQSLLSSLVSSPSFDMLDYSLHFTSASPPPVHDHYKQDIIVTTGLSPSPKSPTQSPDLRETRRASAPAVPIAGPAAADPRPRNHVCETCGNRFLRRQDLRRHATTHSSAREFVCSFGCGAAFGRSDGLTRHERWGKCKQRMARKKALELSALD